MALSIKSGSIEFEVSNITPLSAEFSITASSPDLLPEEDVECGISVALKFKISLNPNNKNRFNEECVETAIKLALAVAIVAILVGLVNAGIAVIIKALIASTALIAG